MVRGAVWCGLRRVAEIKGFTSGSVPRESLKVLGARMNVTPARRMLRAARRMIWGVPMGVLSAGMDVARVVMNGPPLR